MEEYENLKVIDGNLAGFTRFQEYNNQMQESRLDYMVTNNYTDGTEIIRPMATSDHHFIKCILIKFRVPKNNSILNEINKKRG